METAAADVGRNCPDMIFEGTLSMGAIDVRVRDKDCALSSADCAVTGGRSKVCALEALETPMMFSILNDGRLDGSDLIMDAVLRLLS